MKTTLLILIPEEHGLVVDSCTPDDVQLDRVRIKKSTSFETQS
jgi:hypothetical protein